MIEYYHHKKLRLLLENSLDIIMLLLWQHKQSLLEYVMLKEKRVQRYMKKHFTNTWTIEGKPILDEIKPYLKDLDTITFQLIESNTAREALENSKKKD